MQHHRVAKKVIGWESISHHISFLFEVQEDVALRREIRMEGESKVDEAGLKDCMEIRNDIGYKATELTRKIIEACKMSTSSTNRLPKRENKGGE